MTRITAGYYRIARPEGTYTVEKTTEGWVVTSPAGTKAWPMPTKKWAMTLIPGN